MNTIRMNTGQLLSEDEKLRRETSKALINFVLKRSAGNDDVVPSINKPTRRLSSLINIDYLLAKRRAQGVASNQGNNHTNNDNDW